MKVEDLRVIVNNALINPSTFISEVPQKFLGACDRLHSALAQAREVLLQRCSYSDAIASGIAGLPELSDYDDQKRAYLDSILSGVNNGMPYSLQTILSQPLPVTELSGDSASMFLGAVKAATEDEDGCIVTDSAGLSYLLDVSSMHWDNPLQGDIVYCVLADGTKVDFIKVIDGDKVLVCDLMFPQNLSYDSDVHFQDTLQSKLLRRMIVNQTTSPTATNTLYGMASETGNEDAETIFDALDGDVDDNVYDLAGETEEYDSFDLAIVNLTSNVFADLLISGSINDCLLKLLDAADTNDPKTAVDSLYQQYQAGSSKCEQSCLMMVARCKTYVASSGAFGIISYVTNFIKQARDLRVSDSGVILQRTDNRVYLPEYFIAGAISAIAQSVFTVLSMIITIMNQTLGILAMVASSAISSVVGMIQQNVSDTNVSVITDDDTYDPNTLYVSPIGFFYVEVVNNEELSKLNDFFENHNSLMMIDVIGGKLFVGPAAYDEEQNVTRWACELHPLAALINDDILYDYSTHVYPEKYNRILDILQPPYGLYPAVDSAASGFKSEAIYDQLVVGNWYSWFCRTCVTSMPSYEGITSAREDERLRIATNVFLVLFFLTYSVNQWRNESGYFTERICGIDWTQISGAGDPSDWFKGIGTLIACAYRDLANTTTISDPPRISWRTLIEVVENIHQHGQDYNLCFIDNYGSEPRYVDLGLGMSNTTWIASVLNGGDNFHKALSNISTLPSSFQYCYRIPKYDASSLWRNLILAGAITVAVSTVAIIATVKFKQFARKKKVLNKMRFDKAQSNLSEALQGKRTVIDEHGEPVEERFDVNSAEGKQYIDSCYKEYKTVARHNNYWSSFIGGSRYDISTFWGEKEESDSEPILSRFFTDQNEDDVVVTSESTSSYDLKNYLHSLIVGQ